MTQRKMKRTQEIYNRNACEQKVKFSMIKLFVKNSTLIQEVPEKAICAYIKIMK